MIYLHSVSLNIMFCLSVNRVLYVLSHPWVKLLILSREVHNYTNVPVPVTGNVPAYIISTEQMSIKYTFLSNRIKTELCDFVVRFSCRYKENTCLLLNIAQVCPVSARLRKSKMTILLVKSKTFVVHVFV